MHGARCRRPASCGATATAKAARRALGVGIAALFLSRSTATMSVRIGMARHFAQLGAGPVRGSLLFP